MDMEHRQKMAQIAKEMGDSNQKEPKADVDEDVQKIAPKVKAKKHPKANQSVSAYNVFFSAWVLNNFCTAISMILY